LCQLVRRVRPRQSGVRARVSGGHHFTDLTPRRPTRLHDPPTGTKPTVRPCRAAAAIARPSSPPEAPPNLPPPRPRRAAEAEMTVVSFPLEVKCYDNTKTSLCMRLQSVL